MNTQKHPFAEDIFALISASALISLGVYFLKQASLLSGGTAGLGLILTQLTEYSFGQIFFVLNLPFYYLAWRYVGVRFTINTLVSVTVVSVCVDMLPHIVVIQEVDAIYAAIIAGLLTGVGMLIMFRHNASLGGVGILGIYLQKVFNLSAGKCMLAFDICIMIVAFIILPPWLVLLSVLAAVCVSLVLIINHKPFRYQLR